VGENAPLDPGGETGETGESKWIKSLQARQGVNSVISNMKKSVIPRSLREDSAWFVTGAVEDGPFAQLTKMRYSPNTLGELRWDQPSDFSDFDEALQAVEDNVWLDGLSFRIAKPYVAIVGMDVLANGRLSKYFRPVPTQVGGYWEKRNATDVLGIVRAESVPPFGLGWFRGYLVYVWNDGPTPISGQPVPGLNRDPERTDQAALQRFFSEARWDSVWVTAKLKENERRRKDRESQLHLFRSS
jgi:hypothetical protein